MRLVHFSDLHLGFRQFQRQTSAGINQREADVAQAFKRAVDATISLRPDLVVVAGDVFHQVRPSNPAIIHAYVQFQRLVTELGGAPVVVIAGNHDTPRTAETGSILGLFRRVGVHVADQTAERFTFEDRSLSVLAVPQVPPKPALTIDASMRWNVLVLHGGIREYMPEWAVESDRASVAWDRAELLAANWSYIALGDRHVHRQVADNAWFSGSLEYASVDPWGEYREAKESKLPGKGIVEHDLATGVHTFHPIPPARALLDLEPIDCRGLGAQEIDEAIGVAVKRVKGGIEDKIIRLLLWNVPRHVSRELDHKAIREYKARALHFQLDTRKPDAIRPRVGEAAPGGRRQALADLVREKLQARAIEPGLDRGRLVELGLQYLRDADDVVSVPSATGDDA